MKDLLKKNLIPVSLMAFIAMSVFLGAASCNKESDPPKENLNIVSCMAGDLILQTAAQVTNVPMNLDFSITFSAAVDTVTAKQSISLKNESSSSVSIQFYFENENKTVVLKHLQDLSKLETYTLAIANTLKGSEGESFSGAQYRFTTSDGNFTLEAATLDGDNFIAPGNYYNIKRSGLEIVLDFSEAVDTNDINTFITLSAQQIFNFTYENDFKKVRLACKQDLQGYIKYNFVVSSGLKSAVGNSFKGFSNAFFTELDTTPKFPLISDEELLTLVQHQTFRFFYDYAHPVSGMTRERFGSGDIVTSGGSGFGVMALIVGIERGFITRAEGMERMEKIITFLETCDRFHGAWSHWINGSTGKVVPFSTKDNGGDLVETAYMAQGLMTVRQYLDPGNPAENEYISRINEILNDIEWSWYQRGGQNVLYWHWSPNYGWDMNMKISGYNETLITYIMAAASTTYTIPAAAYHSGYARNGGIVNGKTFYGYVLPVGYDYGGPLFFAHYSFLGLDPRNLSDNYANYWTQNVNHSLINWAYCADNPKGYPNYSEQCWGLTAGDIPSGYGVSEPTNDRGVITPTAAVSSLPYTPEQSMEAIRYFYYMVGDHLWGDYGFYDAFDVHLGWWADSFISIDQGPQVIMIENYRSGLLWDLFMSAPEVQQGLDKLGFTYTKQ